MALFIAIPAVIMFLFIAPEKFGAADTRPFDLAAESKPPTPPTFAEKEEQPLSAAAVFDSNTERNPPAPSPKPSKWSSR